MKKATPGLPLFLFNYSDRKLHGIYEAVSSGGMNISPNAWITSSDGAETTPYPAQVRITNEYGIPCVVMQRRMSFGWFSGFGILRMVRIKKSL